MPKEELLTIEGVVDEILPDGRFGVMLDNEYRIIAYTAGKMRRYRIRSIVGDRVHVEMTPYDLSKGRIVFREKLAGSHRGRGAGEVSTVKGGAATCGMRPLNSFSVSRLEIGRLHLAALVLLDIVRHPLVFAQRAHSRALDIGDMDERVGSATLGLDEAETFELVEKLDCACGHLTIPSPGEPERRILDC